MSWNGHGKLENMIGVEREREMKDEPGTLNGFSSSL